MCTSTKDTQSNTGSEGENEKVYTCENVRMWEHPYRVNEQDACPRSVNVNYDTIDCFGCEREWFMSDEEAFENANVVNGNVTLQSLLFFVIINCDSQAFYALFKTQVKVYCDVLNFPKMFSYVSTTHVQYYVCSL